MLQRHVGALFKNSVIALPCLLPLRKSSSMALPCPRDAVSATHVVCSTCNILAQTCPELRTTQETHLKSHDGHGYCLDVRTGVPGASCCWEAARRTCGPAAHCCARCGHQERHSHDSMLHMPQVAGVPINSAGRQWTLHHLRLLGAADGLYPCAAVIVAMPGRQAEQRRCRRHRWAALSCHWGVLR